MRKTSSSSGQGLEVQAPGQAVQVAHQTHLAQHVLVVRQAVAVHADGDVKPGVDHRADRRYTAAQAQIRTGVVANRYAPLGGQRDFRLVQPGAVGEAGGGS